MSRRLVVRGAVFASLCLSALVLAGCMNLQDLATVDFEWTPTSGANPLLVDFTPLVSEEAVGYLWSFGDGTTSTEEAPSHTYTAAGTYSVLLTVEFADGATKSVRKPSCVEVVRVGFKEQPPGLLYWLDSNAGTISRGSRDGAGAATTVVREILNGVSLAIGSDKIFWTYSSGVRRSQLDGTSQETIVWNQRMATGIGVDTKNGKVYWTSLPSSMMSPTYYTGGIYRANLDGTGMQTLKSYSGGVGSGDAFAWPLVVDPAGGKVFWLLKGYDFTMPRGYSCYKTIQATAVGGFAPYTVISSVCPAMQMAVSVGLSAAARYLYWTDYEAGKIFRCKTDGTELTALLTGLQYPRGIAVDASENALYWCDTGGIHRANQDGTGATLIYPGTRANALALDL